MKVVYVTSSLGVGGIEVNLIRLTRELRSRGHEVVVAAAGGSLVPALLEAGARHVEVTLKYRQPLGALRSVLRLRQLLHDERPDVVHVFSASGAAVAWPAVKLRWPRRPRPFVVSTIMGLKMAATEPEWVTRLRAWGVALGADRLMITAPAIGEVVASLPIARRRVVEGQVVGLAEPEPDLLPSPVREELGLVPSDRLVVTIGRLAADKSHDLFLDAAARVRETHPHVRFLVVGGGPLREALEAHLARRALTGTAFLLGERHDVDGILRAADLCVKPGVVEGFVGMTVLEAQLLHLPVVAFDTDDVRLAIRDGESGLIVPAGDVDAMSAAIVRILDDPALAASLGEAGARDVRASFSMPRIVDGLLSLYEAGVA